MSSATVGNRPPGGRTHFSELYAKRFKGGQEIGRLLDDELSRLRQVTVGLPTSHGSTHLQGGSDPFPLPSSQPLAVQIGGTGFHGPGPSFIPEGTQFVLEDASAAAVLLGRGSAAGAGDFEEITLGSGLAMIGTVLNVVEVTEGIWRYSTSVTMADPLAGKLRTNTTSPPTTTQLAISDITDYGTDRAQLLQALAAGDTIAIQDQSDHNNWERYTVASTPTDNTTWFLIPVTYVSHGGVTPLNNVQVVVAFTMTGTGAGGGGITDGDKGDITVSGSGSVWTIDPDAVTYAKMQNVSAGSVLLGRGSSGAGDPQEITLGANLSMAGTVLSAAGGGSGGAPTSSSYVVVGFDATLTAERRLQVEAGVLALTDAGANADITVSVAALGIGTAKLADASVTYAKLQDASAASRLLGRGSLAGAGDFEEVTVGSGLAMTGTVLSVTGSVGPGSGAPYVVVSLDPTLSADRRLQVEASVLTLADGGANADITISVTANGITDAKLRQGAATSVVGRASNTTGNLADIAAGADDRVLARAASALSFQQVSTAMIANDAVTYAKLQTVANFSVIGKPSVLGADPSDITAADETVLGRTAGGSLAFAALATGQIAASAVTYAKMQNASAASVLVGRGAAAGAGVLQEITLGSGLAMTGTVLSSTVGSASGWTDAGTFVHLTTGTDTIVAGPSASTDAAYRLTVDGDTKVIGNVRPEADGTRILGSVSQRFRDLWTVRILSGVGVGATGVGRINTASEGIVDFHYFGEHAGDTTNQGCYVRFQRSRGTLAAPTPVTTGDLISAWHFRARSPAATYVNAVIEQFYVESNVNQPGGRADFYVLRDDASMPGVENILSFTNKGNVVLGSTVAKATTTTDGFVYITGCAGTPTGVPTVYTSALGALPMIYDTTNFILYIYSGGAWRAH